MFQLAVGVASVVLVLAKDEYAESFADFYNVGKSKGKVIAGVVIILAVLSQLVIIIMVTQLLLLHVWLYKHNLTTYDYTLYEREKENNPELNIEMEDARKFHKSKVIMRKNTVEEDETRRRTLAERAHQREPSSPIENVQNKTSFCAFLCCSKSAAVAPPVQSEEKKAIPEIVVPQNVVFAAIIDIRQICWSK